MVAPTALNGDAGHGRQGSGDSQQNRASRTPSDGAHSGTGTESTGTARRASGDTSNNRRSRDDNDHGDHRPSSRPRTSMVPCCDCTRQSTCYSKPSASREGCACRAASRRCVSCTCFRQCRNKMAVITNSTGRFQNFFNNTVAALSGATDPQSTTICPTIFTPESGSGTSLVAASAAADTTSVESAAASAAATESQPSSQQSTSQSVSGPSNLRNSRQTQDPSGATAEDPPLPPAKDPLAPPTSTCSYGLDYGSGSRSPGLRVSPG